MFCAMKRKNVSNGFKNEEFAEPACARKQGMGWFNLMGTRT